MEYCFSWTESLWYGSWNRHVCRKGKCAADRHSRSTGVNPSRKQRCCSPSCHWSQAQHGSCVRFLNWLFAISFYRKWECWLDQIRYKREIWAIDNVMWKILSKNTHMKYESPTINGSKVMAQVKDFDRATNADADVDTDSCLTWVMMYAPWTIVPTCYECSACSACYLIPTNWTNLTWAGRTSVTRRRQTSDI